MKKITVLLFLALTYLQGFAQKPAYLEDSLYYTQNYTQKTVMIKMRDGVSLYAEIHIPKSISPTNKYPFLMTRTPYNATGESIGLYKRASEAKLLREGFIFVETDVRGRWHSEGKFINVRPEGSNPDKKKQKETDESTDTYDTIDWLLANIPNNNGKVGIWGISYPGFYTTVAALSNHPALKAVSPQAPVTDWFNGDDVHHNGAFFWMDFFTFFPIFENDDPNHKIFHSFGVLPFNQSDNYDYFLNTVKTPENANSHFFKDSIPFWLDILHHPNNDSFWKNMNPLSHAYNLKPAVLIVGGWYDAEDLYGTLKSYKTIEAQNPKTDNKIVMGPWFHGGWLTKGESLGDTRFGSATGTYYMDSVFIPFMKSNLKESGKNNLAEATVFETGNNTWRKFSTWPPQNITDKSLYLSGNGGLSLNKPSGTNSFNEYVSDPMHPVPYQDIVSFARTRDYMVDDQRFAHRRPDVITYQTEPLTEDITFAGPITANLFASLTTTDADFVVKVIDVLPRPDNATASSRTGDPGRSLPEQGYEHLVRAEIMRGKFRNSSDSPEAFKPGEITSVHFDLPDLLHTFKKGHRIMVQVQSSWFPLVDRNTQQFMDINKAQPEDYIKSTIRIYSDQEHPSNILFHVLK